jgi:HupE / UreJ protein
VLCACVLVSLASPARAHDLAVDQVMLWPDQAAGALRGQITFDPELTRSKDVRPTEEDARRAVEFLNTHLDLTLDARRALLHFEVRELWMRGGATVGDVVSFSTELGASVRELRVHASGFKALVVSVQRVSAPAKKTEPGSAAPAPIETTSWLLGKDEWTPAYHLDSGWREPGWRAGGPDAFNDVSPSAASAPPPEAAPREGVEAPPASTAGLAARFVRLGFEHILPGGFDHVLFVSGLVLARARRYRQVLISLSLFTLAHTLTLALGHFQLVQVSPRVVEPLIAFSIFVLGVDNLRSRRSVEAPVAARHLVVFSFGLVHGLGFASALSELAFDRDHLVLALLSFNVGVELGQVVVVALLALLLHSIRRWRELEQYATLAGSAAIAASGLVLVIDRVVDDGAASTFIPAPSADPPLSQSLTHSPDRSL